MLLGAALLLTGCRSTGQQLVSRPARHTIQADHFTVMTNFRLKNKHPLITELEEVRKQVTETLDLPVDQHQEQVSVYIFSSELEYHQYLQATYPGLPRRRAYFIGTPGELAVYTFWGDRIREDLRHEFTHGILHAGSKNVPLWLDEGLAEYFEVTHAGGTNDEYVERLTTAINNGWRPDIRRLERLEEVGQMQRADYQEAWAWVHLMLHDVPQGRELLLSYLAELRTSAHPAPFTDRLDAKFPGATTRLLDHIASLQSNGHWVGAK
jgi:hypothetical protein